MYLDKSKIKSCLIIKIYLICILFSWLNSSISLIYTIIYALTGYNDTILYRFLLFFSQLFYFIAQILFLLILMFCINGYLITSIQLSKKILLQIKILMILYILIQIIILIINTTVRTNDVKKFLFKIVCFIKIINRRIPDENILLICNCIQIILYFTSYFWFIFSILLITKKFYSFLIFSIWYENKFIMIYSIKNFI